MATGKVWKKRIEKLDDETLLQAVAATTAIKNLEKAWPFFEQEYGWVGLSGEFCGLYGFVVDEARKRKLM